MIYPSLVSIFTCIFVFLITFYTLHQFFVLYSLHHLSDWIRLLVNHPTLIDDLYQSTAFIFITSELFTI